MRVHALAALGAVALSMPGCGLAQPTILGSGTAVRIDADAPEFTRIRANHSFDVHVVPADAPSVTVGVDDNLAEHLVVEVRGGTLILGLEPGYDYADVTLTARVRMPALDALALSGACRATVDGFEDVGALAIDLTGASTLDLNVGAGLVTIDLRGASRLDGTLRCVELRGDLSGACELALAGQAQRLDLDASGASRIEAARFVADDVTLDVHGASCANVHARDVIAVGAHGASSVSFTGHPPIRRVDRSGASSVRRR